jgi:hypothetical protein
LSSALAAGPCPRHPERSASLACASCGKAICIDCGGEHQAKRYCDPCLASVYERVATVEATRSRGMSGLTAGIIALSTIAVLGGLIWIIAQPSIEKAKERSRWRMCELGLTRIYDAARLYAEDHRRFLPRGPDGTTEGLVRALVDMGYLREAPKNVTGGAILEGDHTLDGNPLAPYIVDDASHGVPPDVKRHVLRADGTISRMTEADWAAELAAAVTATAAVRPASAPTTVTPTTVTPTGRR